MTQASPHLSKALHKFQAEAPALQRDKINPHFRSAYLSLEGLMGEVLPALNRAGLIVVQLPCVLDGEPALRTRLIHAESGESIEETMLLLLAKADPQGHGSGITYARRYALMAFLGLVADEDDDANAATGSRQRAPRPGRSARKDGAPSSPSEPAKRGRASKSGESAPGSAPAEASGEFISDNDRRRLFEFAKEKGITEPNLKRLISLTAGVSSTSKIPAEKVAAVLEAVGAWSKA